MGSGSEDGVNESKSADLAKVTINAQLNDADGSETLFLDFSNLSNIKNLVAPDGTKVLVSNNQATSNLFNWPKPYEIGIEANEHFSGQINFDVVARAVESSNNNTAISDSKSVSLILNLLQIFQLLLCLK